jgi:RsiW-degrading membrane proteinase PrsW (M82 family)
MSHRNDFLRLKYCPNQSVAFTLLNVEFQTLVQEIFSCHIRFIGAHKKYNCKVCIILITTSNLSLSPKTSRKIFYFSNFPLRFQWTCNYKKRSHDQHENIVIIIIIIIIIMYVKIALIRKSFLKAALGSGLKGGLPDIPH